MQMTLLNNFYTILRTELFGNTGNIGEILTNCNPSTIPNKVLGGLKDIAGNDILTLFFQNNQASSGVSAYMTNAFGFFQNRNTDVWSSSTHYFGVGSSNSAVAMDDHELYAPITTDITIARMAATNPNGITFNVIVSNSGTADITVAEIGIYNLVYFKANDTSSSPADRRVLIARAVLDSAVTIPAGESKTFDVALSLALPA